jgi:hypothetical protein
VRTIFIIVAVALSAFTAKAAAPVSGKIIDETSGDPLEYVNIVLLSLPDSAFVAGTVSKEDGVFLFNSLNDGDYLLKISYIGLENKLIPINVSGAPVSLGYIHLKESALLSELVVTTKTPPFQLNAAGGIVANVSTTLLSSVGTATDVLQRMPGIMADNGAVTVFGKGAPIVYINNRKVNDMTELERLESSEISTVELILNPGAKYDAEGRAVLLVKTKAKVSGLSAQLMERLRQGQYAGDTENFSISYAKDRLNLFTSYYHSYSKREAVEDHLFVLNNPDSLWQYSSLMPDYWYSSHSQEINAGFDFSVNDRHAIGGQYQFYERDGKEALLTLADTYLNEALYETSQAQSRMGDNSRQQLVNAFYNGDFSERFSLRFDFDYLKNHADKRQHSDETVNSSESNRVDISNNTDYDLFAGKLTNSYQSSAGLFEFGGEYNHIAGNGFVRSNGFTDNSEFTNTEQKAAAFASYSHRLAAIHFAAGIRYEFTSERFTEGSARNPFIDRTYSDFYPNVSLSTSLKDVDLSLAFNKRTQRPGFGQLNGNVLYINRFLFQRGNPYLTKSNIYDINLQAIAKPFYLNLGYTYTENPVTLFFEQQANTNNAILLTYTNFPKMQDVNATLNFNHKIAFWQPNYTAGIAKPFFSALYEGREITYDKLNYFFRAYNDFTLPYGFVLSCNFRYQSDEQYNFLESTGSQRLDVGLRKSLLDNALRLNLMVYDVFDQETGGQQAQLNNLRWNANKKYETRYATLSVTYMLNNYKKKYRGQNAAQDDINRF